MISENGNTSCIHCDEVGFYDPNRRVYLCPWHSMTVSDQLDFMKRLERDGVYDGKREKTRVEIAKETLLERFRVSDGERLSK